MSIENRIGNMIREKRISLSLSQEDLALRSGLHRTYIGSVERGERNITVRNLFRIAGALECKAYELIDFEIEE